MSFINVAVVASVIGTVTSVKGQMDAANAADATGKYNAQIKRDEAVRQTNVAAENARRKERENAGIIGRQRAAMAQSGMAMEGTPLAILGETSMMLNRDILDIGYEAKNKTRSLQAAANMSIWEGKTQASIMRTQAVATGLKGIASAASGFAGATGTTPGATNLKSYSAGS